MSSSSTFWALVRHEFSIKGSWRKQNRSPLTRGWRLIYFLLIAIIAFGSVTYFTIHDQFPLSRLWVIFMGFPYAVAAFGVGMLKREWENETYGWWLTLPYSRFWLISAKWIAAWLRVLVVMVAAFVLLTLYALIIALSLEQYSAFDVESSIVTGLQWFFLVVGFSPFLLALSTLISSSRYSSLRPITPFLWVIVFGGIGLYYSGSDTFLPINQMTHKLASEHVLNWFPFPWEVPVTMVASWIIAWAIIRFSAFLLDKKLSL